MDAKPGGPSCPSRRQMFKQLAAGSVSLGACSAARSAEPEVSNSRFRRLFNIDFGPWMPDERSGQKGPAAIGREDDFWNIVGIPWSNHHRVNRLTYASGDSSTIHVELKNLGGAWNSGGKMGVKSAMLNCYHYPMNNQGGDSEVILHRVPPGRFALYLYGHGPYANYYGDYEVSIGKRNYGRKKTAARREACEAEQWNEGWQFVRFPELEIAYDESIRIYIRPGGEIIDPHGRRIRDAMICGLQLLPLA